MQSARSPQQGDLVVTQDGYFALIKEVLPGDRLRVRLANGLVTDVALATVVRQGLGPSRGQDGGRALASFFEEMRPEWADPYSPRYRPPAPALDSEEGTCS